jgi:lysophospholipase L1-like esterase
MNGILARLPSRRLRHRLFIGYAVILTLIAVPLFYNQYLRAEYVNLIANWRAKVHRPTFALIGDSITAGGGVWGWRLAHDPFGAINFGTNGNTLRQVAGQSGKALGLHPRYLLIEGGINDFLLEEHDPSRWAVGMENIARDAARVDARVVLTLPLPTADAKANAALLVMRDRLRHVFPGAICVDATHALAPDGLLKSEYTVDGAHFTEAGYRIWATQIRAAIEHDTRC